MRCIGCANRFVVLRSTLVNLFGEKVDAETHHGDFV